MGFSKRLIQNKKSDLVIILVFVGLAIFMVTATHYGTKTLSAVRAYIAGEGQWIQNQKEAVNLLLQYSIEQDSVLYEKFQEKLELHKGFQKARQTLTSENPDYDLAVKGFQKGDHSPEDIELKIWLAQFYDDVTYLVEAFDLWRQGDKRIAELENLGQQLHQAVRSGRLDADLRTEFIQDIQALDQTTTAQLRSFSVTMEEGARWIRGVIFWSIVVLGSLLIITGYVITRRLFGEISDLNQQLKESDAKFKQVLQNSRDIIYQINFASGDYEYMSPAVESMLGYSREEILAEGPNFVLDRIHPEDRRQMDQRIQEMKGKGVEDHFAKESEYRIQRADGEYIWVSNQRKLVKDEEGNPVAIVGSVRDISDRKKHEVETEKSLKEKQTLLEEIHHRVKNNLAIISGMVELQKTESDESVQPILEDVQSRIMSIAMVHEKLYQTETLSDIDMKDYIEDFTDMIAHSFNSEQKDITITQKIQSFSLDITKAVPLGLIVNELLNNAYKHGFSKAKSGKLCIMLKKENGSAILCVADNGKGLPDHFNFEKVQSLGMNLIQTLTKQLEGEIEIIDNDWTTFQITFPLKVESENREEK